jgi:hypothetical protein
MREAGFKQIRHYKPGESNERHLQGIETHNSLISEMMNDFETMVLEGDRP